MAYKPVYYSGTPKLAYGGSNQPVYYGKGPLYYGSNRQYGGAYGAYGSYGAYGGVYGAAGGNAGSGDGGSESIVGTITVGRMLRVISQRWLTIFVFLLIGLVVAFAVYRVSPTVYQARSEFTMDVRRPKASAIEQMAPDLGGSYGEILNTRLSDWKSDKVISRIVQQYRAEHPSSTVSDGELVGVLCGADFDLQRNSRIIFITTRSKSPHLAAALANAYTAAIEQFTDEENKLRCDKAVVQLHGIWEKKRREVDKIAKDLLEFRSAHKLDQLRSARDMTQQALSKATSDILALETQEAQLVEWEKLLVAVQQDPANYGNLSTGVPRAGEIATEYRAFQDATGAYQGLLVNFTTNHPDVVSHAHALDLAKKRFLDAAHRALLTGRSMLGVTRNQMAGLRAKQDVLKNDLAEVEQKIVYAESGMGQLQAEFNVANEVLKGLILDENKARMEAESNNEIVRLGRPASVPSVPVLPNPKLIFGAGVLLSLALGVVFVLVLDNLEDTVVNLSDIEGRLALKVLAVLPHVRRNKREQVAKFTAEDKYSQFAEAVAGLRNLLDSPRYEAMTRCMLVISTQPGEGKTITSTSIAISYAQAGRKTLYVDFDLRRPRGAAVWDLKLTKERSFSHVIQKAAETGVEKPDFAALVNPTSVRGLDVISSLPPEGVSPATIFGASVVGRFFEWARANYDHVIVDSPPYGVVGDVVSLSMVVDSAIIMCCPDRTHFKPIQYCTRCLTEAGANILGVIVNDVEISNASAFSPSARHHRNYDDGEGGYGYGYGYGYRPAKNRKGAKAPDAAAPADAQTGEAKPKGDGKFAVRPEENEEFTDDE